MFRTLSIAVGAGEAPDRLDEAIRLAQALDAHLAVTVISRAPAPRLASYATVAAEIWAAEARAGLQAAKERAAEIERMMAEAGIEGDVDPVSAEPAVVDNVMAERARYADITLVTPGAEGWEDVQAQALSGALFASGRPVLLRPVADPPFAVAPRVLVAWDASVEASRAVGDALPILAGADIVHVLLVDPVPSEGGHGPEPGADLGAYLARHDVPVVIDREPSEGRPIAEVINRRATDFEVDLIVMGGYGHMRLAQRIFGGVTEDMLRESAVQVLISR
ncbi:MAG: universal stress protein [Pseudomonadota bacterium]